MEIRAGGDQLSPRTDQEGFLGPTFRLACQATVERTRARRRVRGPAPPAADPPGARRPPGEAPELDPAVTVVDGRFRGDDGSDLGAATGSPVGVAIDVGTTTVVLELVDLETGAILAVAALENPQRFGGSDVMTRISYDDEVPGELRQALRRALNHELKRLCADLGVDRRRLVDAYVVGNSTMRDMFFGLDVKPIGHIPYRSVTEIAVREGTAASTTIVRRAHEIGLLMNPQARVTGGPLIASHVGADAAADLVAVDAVAAAARSCSWTSAPTARSSSRTGPGSSRRRAPPAPPSRAAACATGCPAPTARSRRSGSWTAASTSARSATCRPRASAAPGSWTSSRSCAGPAG